MVKRPFLIAVAGLLVVVGALLLLFFSDEELVENNTHSDKTVNSSVIQNPSKNSANRNEKQAESQAHDYQGPESARGARASGSRGGMNPSKTNYSSHDSSTRKSTVTFR